MHRLLLNALRLLCLLCRGLVSVGACCRGAVLPLPLASWSLRAPSLSTNLFWTLRCRLEHLHTSLFVARSHHCSSSYLCADRTAHVQRRVQSLLANITIARPCGRSCRSCELCLPSCSVVAVALLRLLQAPPFVEVSPPRECLAHFACSPGRRRLDVSSRTRNTSALSPLRCLACVAVPT